MKLTRDREQPYLGQCVMELKQLADEYRFLMIVCDSLPQKHGVEKRQSGDGE